MRAKIQVLGIDTRRRVTGVQNVCPVRFRLAMVQNPRETMRAHLFSLVPDLAVSL